jgi:PPK2 family polyphosphate:nucleotide phosphotransferase
MRSADAVGVIGSGARNPAGQDSLTQAITGEQGRELGNTTLVQGCHAKPPRSSHLRHNVQMRVDRFRVRPKDGNALRNHPPDGTPGIQGKEEALEQLRRGIERLRARQELLYAQDRYALLLVFQGMDGAGKDSAIRHVMSGVSPQSTDVHAFKVPSAEERDHDYLWRVSRVLPERGRIGIFNRSHYEEVLTVRVHPHLLAEEQLPAEHVTRHIWRDRFKDINAFERHLFRNGTIIRKFFLHVSRGEQRRRMLERLDDPTKNWKFNSGDLDDRAKWKSFMSAYSDAIAATSRDHAPWYVIPADHKWFAHALIAEIVVQTLEDLDLAFPTMPPGRRRELRIARRRLLGRS